MFYSDKVYKREKVGVNMKPSIYGLTQTDLVDWLVDQGEKKFIQMPQLSMGREINPNMPVVF